MRRRHAVRKPRRQHPRVSHLFHLTLYVVRVCQKSDHHSAATHALINVLPLYLMASQSDVGAECDNPHHDGHYRPQRLLIYDRHPGGVGIARQAAPIFMELLRAAVELVEGCGCGGGVSAGDSKDEDGQGATRREKRRDQEEEEEEVVVVEDADVDVDVDADLDRTGCPGCVHYLSCDQYNAVLDKRAALVVLRHTITAEERAFALPSPPPHGEKKKEKEKEKEEEKKHGGNGERSTVCSECETPCVAVAAAVATDAPVIGCGCGYIIPPGESRGVARSKRGGFMRWNEENV